MNDFSQFLQFTDEVFTTETSYDKTVGFIKFLAADPDENLSLTDEILVMELKEGVFIRTGNAAWSKALMALVKEPNKAYPIFKTYPPEKLDDLARNYRQPLDSFGDYRLIRWKVGF
jgi:hypothetical protein